MRFTMILAAIGLSGCAATSYCTGEQDYQSAKSVAPVKSADGVPLPQSPSALQIPDPPANAVAYGETYKDADGDEQVRCLDTPPQLPPAAPLATPDEKPKV